MRLVRIGWCASLVLIAATAQAEPLNLKQVAAGAGWLSHVDFDAARDSTVHQKMLRRAMDKHKQLEGQLKMVEGLIGMNLLKDFHGLTLYGPQIGKHRGVAILHGNMKKELIQPWIDQIPKRETSSYGDYQLQSWTHEHHGKKHTISATWHGGNRLVVASGVEDLIAALSVIDGKAGSMSADGPLGGNIPAGTGFLLRVTGISQIECKEPLVKQTESFRIVAGEHNGESFFRLRVVMNNAETAAQFKEVAEGLKAVAMLHHRKDEAAKKLVAASSIKLEDKSLTVLWSASANDVWAVTEKQIERLEKMMAKHKERRHRAGPGRPGGEKKPDAPRPPKKAEDDF